MIRFHEHPGETRSLTADYRPEEPVYQRMQKFFPDTTLYLTHSATASLEAIALFLDLSPKDEIILPSFTYVSTASAFQRCGARLVFVDVDSTMNLDPLQAMQAVTPKTRVIVAVHYASYSCDLAPLVEFCQNRKIILIEDAAQAMGASYRGRPLGTLGDFGVISFHQTKILHAGGEGGLLLQKKADPRLLQILENGTNRQDFYRGLQSSYSWQQPGSTFLMDGLHRDYLNLQLDQFPHSLTKRRSLLRQYHELLAPLEEQGHFKRMELPSWNEGNAHLYYIITKDPKERQNLIAFLAQRKIDSRPHYVPLHESPMGKRFGTFHGKDLGTERAWRLLRLPLHEGMSLFDVECVNRELEAFYG